MIFSEFFIEVDLEDFIEVVVDVDDEDEEEGEEVVEDCDYYYDIFKGDDYNEENLIEFSSDGIILEKEIIYDVKGNVMLSCGVKICMVIIYLEFGVVFIIGKL